MHYLIVYWVSLNFIRSRIWRSLNTGWLKSLKAKMKECVFFNEIIFFIQYNLPQLEHTYSNDPPIILYHLCNDFPEALQNTVPRLQ